MSGYVQDRTGLRTLRCPGTLSRHADPGEGPLTVEQERWAEALTILRQHGSDAPRWVAERVGALALAGDVAGVGRFADIAERMEQVLAARLPS